ncbi:Alpha/beta hydrolase fold-3, partial [Ilyonectria sp. MPI-CAGE-AT-0026]
FPLYLYFHGGGFVFGSIHSDVAECARISTSSGMLVLSANYRHTDTHPFPAQHDDAWSALQFVLSSSPELRQVDHTRILVAGASAGANLALVTALRAGAENIPLAGLVLQSPWLADPALFPDSSSASQHAAGPVVTAADLAWYVALLAAGTAASPLLAADEDLLKLPRTYVQVCGMDPLRDDGLVFCARLKEMGIDVGLDVYPGLPHAFNNI